MASLALLLVAATIRPVYVIIWSVLLAATSYNLTRFWPRRRARPGLLLGQQEADALRTAVDPDGRLAWPDVVRLVPRAELELAEGELVLGMPLLACLDPGELRELLRRGRACRPRSRTSARCGGRSGSRTATSAGRWWAAGRG